MCISIRTLIFASAALLLASPLAAAPQAIEWSPVRLTGPSGKRIDAQRGLLEVPENRSKAGSRRVQLQIGRLRGNAKGAPIVYLHGGPGGSATSTVRSQAYLSIWEALLPLGDVILLDQRGGGRSKPSLQFRLTEPPARDVFASRERLATWLAKVSEQEAKRLRKQNVDTTAYNNLENMADIEALREALGVEKIRLVGFSFGSHLGLSFLRRYPESVASAVLIGIEGPDHTRKLPRTLDVHWRKLMLRAARDPALVPDKDALDGLLQRTLTKLRAKPLVVPIRHPRTGKSLEFELGPFGLRFLLMMDLGDSSDLPVLPRLVHEVSEGKTDMLAWFMSKRISLIANLPGVLFTMDSGAGASNARWAAIREQAARSLFANAMNLDYPAAEAQFRPKPLGDAYRRPVLSDVRTLFVSGELDSNTPPFQAELVRWGFSRSVHLVAANAGHTGCWIGNPKTTRAISAFFAGKDVRNRDIDLPALRFAALRGPTSVQHPSLPK